MSGQASPGGGRLATFPADPVGPPAGLYVHVPFCVSICPYCDFVVLAGKDTRGPAARIDAFVRALLVELDLRAEAIDERFGPDRPALETLYLGGGTPSLLPADLLAELVARVRDRFGLVDWAEVTLEANPGPDERGDPVAQRAAGVTRLSIGVQSFEPAELSRLGRRHSPRDVRAAVDAVRGAGIPSLNLDLLYDVPGQTMASWSASLESALALEPDHLSLYSLALDDPAAEGATGPLGDHLPASAGALRWRGRARPEQDEDRAVGMYHLAVHRLSEAGFRGYELSNWARPGHESRHNRLYWTRRPVEGLGPGAHAFDGSSRRWNAARLDGYLAALLPGDDGLASGPTLPPGGAETPATPDEAKAEALILGLRLDDGVPLAALVDDRFAAAFGWASELGLLEPALDGDRARLTTQGRLLSNELFSRLL